MENLDSPPAPTMALARRSPFDGVTDLVQHLEGLEVLSQVLCKSTLLPRDMQTPANLKLVLLQGLEMGFTPIQAIRASFIITSKDQPAKVGYYVEALVALVRQSSVCRFFRIDVADATKCRVSCARKDEDEAIVHSFELTLVEAQKANLDKKWTRNPTTGKFEPEQKYTWFTAPADMIRNRCCGRAVKTVFQDVVFGMATPDELDDVASAEAGERAMAAEYVAVPMPRSTTVTMSTDRSTGDPAYDDMLARLGDFAQVRMSGWLPEDVLEAFTNVLQLAGDRKALGAAQPWLATVASRAAKSKTVADLAAKMSMLYNERNAELRKAAEAPATGKAAS